MTGKLLKGRFAPSPSGRMHLGNVFTALMSWLSVKSRGGSWLLRIEDLDPQRSRREYGFLIEDDLHWLGLDWDEGGMDRCMQSLRGGVYEEWLKKLRGMKLTYPCHCRRADIMATQAPHQSDGRIVYAGTCRPAPEPPFVEDENYGSAATRLWVPATEISFTDKVRGEQCVNLAEFCGDFVLRRADGAWAYQLAVVADDAAMGVTEVMRGNDLLLSTAQQIYLYKLMGYEPPQWAHLPLLCNEHGQRLSKRDSSLNMAQLRERHSAPEILGYLAGLAGLTPDGAPANAAELLELAANSDLFRTLRELPGQLVLQPGRI